MIVVAIDPGAHTGIATRFNNGTWTSQMIHNRIFDLWTYLITAQPSVIIVERFRSPGTRLGTDGQDTIEIQGSVYSVAWMINAELVLQYPRDRTQFIPKARELIGANKTKIQSHGVDALAHLLYWEAKNPNYIERPHRENNAMVLAKLQGLTT